MNARTFLRGMLRHRFNVFDLILFHAGSVAIEAGHFWRGMAIVVVGIMLSGTLAARLGSTK